MKEFNLQKEREHLANLIEGIDDGNVGNHEAVEDPKDIINTSIAYLHNMVNNFWKYYDKQWDGEIDTKQRVKIAKQYIGKISGVANKMNEAVQKL